MNPHRREFLGSVPAAAAIATTVAAADAPDSPMPVVRNPRATSGDLRFEPIGALTDHGDGLSALRTIVAGAPARLKSGGWLLMEHGYDQAAAVRELLTAQGFCEVRSWHDLAGIERVSGARRA